MRLTKNQRSKLKTILNKLDGLISDCGNYNWNGVDESEIKSIRSGMTAMVYCRTLLGLVPPSSDTPFGDQIKLWQASKELYQHLCDDTTTIPLSDAENAQLGQEAIEMRQAYTAAGLPQPDDDPIGKKVGVIWSGSYNKTDWTNHVGYHVIPPNIPDDCSQEWVTDALYDTEDYEDIRIHILMPYDDFVQLGQNILGVKAEIS